MENETQLDSLKLLPQEFLERLQSIIPEDRWEEVQQSFLVSKEISFRCNTLKSDPTKIFEQLSEAEIPFQMVNWYPSAAVSPSDVRSKITHHRFTETGEVYIHNLSSIAAVWALDPKPNQTVLDLAAAPGGKTLQIAAQMSGTGTLSAVEVVRNRFFKLKQNLRNGGAEYAKTFCNDGRQVGVKTGPRFDKVLLDAPCSGEARFDPNNTETFQFWGKKKISDCKRKQQGLIKSAYRALKPGGEMVYSTCSFAPEENEGVLDYLLKKFPDVEIIPIDLPFDNWQAGLESWENKSYRKEVSNSRRILPNQTFNGLFLSKIRKPE